MPDRTKTSVARVDENPDIESPETLDLVTQDDPDEVPPPEDLDLEAPEADVAEQRAPVVDDDANAQVWEPVPDGVDPADRTDQRRAVTRDEEEYR